MKALLLLAFLTTTLAKSYAPAYLSHALTHLDAAYHATRMSLRPPFGSSHGSKKDRHGQSSSSVALLSGRFIFANHITLNGKSYIAGAYPAVSAQADTWDMILEKDISVVVVLAGISERKKRGVYWPTRIGQTKRLNTVVCVGVVTYQTFIAYRLTVAGKTVILFEYLAWPAESTADPNSLLGFLAEVETHRKAGGIFVHCSDGRQRTTAFLVLDSLVKSAGSVRASERTDLVVGAVRQIKAQRYAYMNFEQFRMVYETLALFYIKIGHYFEKGMTPEFTAIAATPSTGVSSPVALPKAKTGSSIISQKHKDFLKSFFRKLNVHDAEADDVIPDPRHFDKDLHDSSNRYYTVNPLHPHDLDEHYDTQSTDASDIFTRTGRLLNRLRGMQQVERNSLIAKASAALNDAGLVPQLPKKTIIGSKYSQVAIASKND